MSSPLFQSAVHSVLCSSGGFSSLLCSGSICWRFHDPTHSLLAPGNFQTLISCLHTSLPNSSSYSLFQVFPAVVCWPFSLPGLYFLPGQAHSDSVCEHTLLPNDFPTFISSPDPFLEFQGSNSTGAKSVKFLSNPHYVSQMDGATLMRIQNPSPQLFPSPLPVCSILPP